MNKLDTWLTKHDLKNMLTLVVVLLFILFINIIIYVYES